MKGEYMFIELTGKKTRKKIIVNKSAIKFVEDVGHCRELYIFEPTPKGITKKDNLIAKLIVSESYKEIRHMLIALPIIARDA